MPAYKNPNPIYTDLSYIYALYIPWHAPAGLRRNIFAYVKGIDELCPDRAVFIIKTSQGTMRYDYDTRVAWNSCYSIKSKNKLCAIRELCNEYLERAAKNEPESEPGPITVNVNFSYYKNITIKGE